MSESVRRHRPRGHEEHGHATDLREVSRRRLWWATAIIFVFLVVEVAAGLVILTTGWMPADQNRLAAFPATSSSVTPGRAQRQTDAVISPASRASTR